MAFTSETARQAGKASKPKGIRKDAISHGLYNMVRSKYGTFEAYFSHLDKIMPGKPADMIAKYIPHEIEQKVSGEVHNVLHIVMPEARVLPEQPQAIDIPCEVRMQDDERAETDARECPVMDDLAPTDGSVCTESDDVGTEAGE